ncbi:MAG TPA: membrane protein insertase YidC [Gemmatimonadaceae bacterium]|nr:membrane protein insertase YidC [Gemmatimonadaceae bacterium]
MDKRFIIFVILAAIILIVTPRIFPPTRHTAPTGTAADTTPRAATVESTTAKAPTAAPAPTVSEAAPPAAPAAASESTLAVAPPARADTITVATPTVVYRFSTVGAAPVGIQLNNYKNLSGNDGPVELARKGTPIMSFMLLRAPGDTVHLDRQLFSVDSTRGASGQLSALTFRTTADGVPVSIAYTFSPDSYLVRVRGSVGTSGSAQQGEQYIIAHLERGLNSQEADTLDDQRHLAYVVKPSDDDAKGTPFSKLDTAEAKFINGPLDWVASKNKYFVLGLLTDSTTGPFSGAKLVGLPPTGKVKNNASAFVLKRLDQQGNFAFTVYAGPQEWRRLLALGNDFDNVNPYGGFFQGIVQPFATIVMRILLWTHDALKLNYGWVLVIFGIAVRLILWPLNQTAMRASLKMQRIQPELQALQKKYKNQPEKQQAEMMKLYKEHGMSPLSPLMGCLPMLIPMPVLFALYFVFQNTIEFRGVSFLWMSDISLMDPYFILPILMGVSMFLLSWIGLRASPSNAQAKMMAYVFPVMMVAFFYRLAAGLNLYYAVQNLAAIPQQWLIARERAKAGPPASRPPTAVAAKTTG